MKHRSRSLRRSRSPRGRNPRTPGERHFEQPVGPAQGAWPFPGFAADVYGGGGCAPGFWDYSPAEERMLDARNHRGSERKSKKKDKKVKKDKKKKKAKKSTKSKQKRARSPSSSSASSSSSSMPDWRQQVWCQGWQGSLWSKVLGCPVPGNPLWQYQQPGDPSALPAAVEHPSSSSTAPSRHQGKKQDLASDDVPIFLEPAVEELVPVPRALLGKVIGKQASNILTIREKSGAFKVDARDQTSDPCQVKVIGTAKAVKKAREMILEILENTRNKHLDSAYVEIPRPKIGMVIGIKGAQVNEIQAQTGTKVDIDFDHDPCRVFIKGEPDNVEAAKRLLLTIAMQLLDDSSEYIEFPKATSAALIGSQGSKIRDFQDQSGARIDVDKTGGKCRVRLCGSREQVANAKQLLLAELEQRNAGRPTPSTFIETNAATQPTPSTFVETNAATQPPVVHVRQPATFPATLSESIARARAAAEAVKRWHMVGDP